MSLRFADRTTSTATQWRPAAASCGLGMRRPHGAVSIGFGEHGLAGVIRPKPHAHHGHAPLAVVQQHFTKIDGAEARLDEHVARYGAVTPSYAPHKGA